MGIQQLLRFMKPFIHPIHIKKYAGKRVGVDAYSWLHKGVYSCSMELCLNYNNEASRRYIQYFMHRINLLRHYNVIPVVVFDGGNIPCKSATEHERQQKKDTNLASAKLMLEKGDIAAAIELFQKAVCVTPSMAYELIQILRLEGVEFVVAPYEADAQLAYLSTLEEERGGFEAVITEDSDLIAYCCKSIVFKMDHYGNGEEIVLEKVFISVSGGLSFKKFDKELLTGMCVLAGCDFLPSVPGIGIKRAYTLVSKYRDLNRVLSVIKYEKGNLMPDGYSKSFIKAVAVFHHARIYDASSKEVRSMKPLTAELLEALDSSLEFLGPFREIPSCIASAIAEGQLDPITREAFANNPQAACPLAHVRNGAYHQDLKSKHLLMFKEQNCITSFPPHGLKTERKSVSRTASGNLVANSRKYTNEAASLKQLLLPPQASKKAAVPFERKAYPDNNPFKSTKPETNDKKKVHIIDQKSTVGSRHCNVEIVTTETQLEHNQKQEAVGAGRELPRKIYHLKRKVKLDVDHSLASPSEEISVVTIVDTSNDANCTTPDSQASVTSRPNKRLKTGKENKQKKVISQANIKNSKDANGSLLRFFNRL